MTYIEHSNRTFARGIWHVKFWTGLEDLVIFLFSGGRGGGESKLMGDNDVILEFWGWLN